MGDNMVLHVKRKRCSEQKSGMAGCMSTIVDTIIFLTSSQPQSLVVAGDIDNEDPPE